MGLDPGEYRVPFSRPVSDDPSDWDIGKNRPQTALLCTVLQDEELTG